MKEALEIINKMQKDGVIGKYAIGGAVGAIYYLEPVPTLDVDIFISFRSEPGSLLVTIEPIYEYLSALGFQAKDAHVPIRETNVQFLPADSGLESEALSEAIETEYDGVTTWVMTAEHLMALAFKVGRKKDFIRIEQFFEKGNYDAIKLREILTRYNLIDKWTKFRAKYIGSTNK
jgi:hypothetical protein